ncbi:MAG: tetratricopeptide repeat protein [Bacteroidetes bacterium]|nr:tetratricopeptide repeat protein [Bacteroidota bacterium]
MASLKELLKKTQSLNKDKKYNKVIELLTDTILKTLNSADLYAEKSQAFYELKKDDLSNEAAEKALSINPKHSKGNNYKGNYYFDNKEYEKAKEFYNKAIKADPKYTLPYNNLGSAYYYLKEYDNAIEFYNKANEADPNHAPACYNLGLTYYDLKEYNKAIEFYNKAIEVDPKYTLPYYNLGLTYYYLKEYDKAIKFYNKAIEADPKYASAYYNLGLTYYDLKEYDKAKEFYHKAIEADPKYTLPYNNLGLAYYYLKEYDKAIEFFNKAIKVDPNHALPYSNLGLTYYDLKEFKKSIELYNKAIEADPKYKSPYYNLGNAYYDLKEYKKSLADYEKYVELTKHNPDYFTSIAESRIIELRKLLENKEYSSISEIVNKIKELLLYKEGRITHYTGLSVAKALVIDIDSSLFRLSEGAYLNDTSEGRELFKFLSFDFSSQNWNDTVATPFTQKPFIGSFVAEFKHDDLTLWRMYGKEKMEEAKGCSITIDTEKLLENLITKITPELKTGTTSKADEEFRFYRVAYRKEGEEDLFIIPGATKKQKDLNKYMKDLSAAVTTFNSKERMDISDTQNVVELLNEIAYLFKSDAYQHEHEVRLVVKGIGFEKNIDSSFHPPRVYIELISIKPLIQQITLGPKVERPDEWAAAFNYSLDKEDYHPDILISHLPFK